jgi:hypothetical protein
MATNSVALSRPMKASVSLRMVPSMHKARFKGKTCAGVRDRVGRSVVRGPCNQRSNKQVA